MEKAGEIRWQQSDPDYIDLWALLFEMDDKDYLVKGKKGDVSGRAKNYEVPRKTQRRWM